MPPKKDKGKDGDKGKKGGEKGGKKAAKPVRQGTRRSTRLEEHPEMRPASYPDYPVPPIARKVASRTPVGYGGIKGPPPKRQRFHTTGLYPTLTSAPRRRPTAAYLNERSLSALRQKQQREQQQQDHEMVLEQRSRLPPSTELKVLANEVVLTGVVIGHGQKLAKSFRN
ncbi:hypothetical protein HDU89_004789 [Geranomyces variabilis]|nr:hypothetical protein HDU89_004789 [Geranomyces variabilis]